MLWLQPVVAQPLPPMTPEHVFDRARALPDSEVSALEAKLRAYATRAPGRIRVSLQPSLPEGQSVEACALQFFQAHHGQPSDVVLLLTLQDHHLTLRMGSRWTGWDDRCRQLVERELVPRLRRNDLSGGIHRTVDEVQQWLLTPPSAPTQQTARGQDGWLDHLEVDKLFYLGLACWSVFLILCKLLGGDRVVVSALIFSGPGALGAMFAAGIAHIVLRSKTAAFAGAVLGFFGSAAGFWLFLAALGRLAAHLGFAPGGAAWAQLQQSGVLSNHRSDEPGYSYSSTERVENVASPAEPPSNPQGFGSGASSTW